MRAASTSASAISAALTLAVIAASASASPARAMPSLVAALGPIVVVVEVPVGVWVVTVVFSQAPRAAVSVTAPSRKRRRSGDERMGTPG
jgi:hypothetical protein